MSFDSCQLYRRQWIIKFNDNVLGDFNGEAVIGQFVYECCITSTASPASIEGSYMFIPGRRVVICSSYLFLAFVLDKFVNCV
ncbi:putative ApaG domain-containing protein [Helianthus annuus]|uniref:ApaG domain-containing protein n=1 Tax=Helianthus annuus TaxID=4232 RepID=A0A9K3DS42_HELAN|nr:putative ApaG domain-containing protein [Helianthus annuus]